MDSINVNLDNLTPDEREQLLKLIEKSKEVESKSKVWKPALREDYYGFAYDSDDDGVGCFLWKNDEIDALNWSIGNCYHTQEEAKFAIERMKVLTELQRYADEHNEGEIDWSTSDTDKYNIYFDHDDKNFFIYTNQYLQNNKVYFTSQAIADDAIKAIGANRIKKYLFNIED